MLFRSVRNRGFALVDQELEIGLRSLGVPIINKSSVTVAGLSVSVVDGQAASESLVKRYLEPLREAAREINASLPT